MNLREQIAHALAVHEDESGGQHGILGFEEYETCCLDVIMGVVETALREASQDPDDEAAAESREALYSPWEGMAG